MWGGGKRVNPEEESDTEPSTTTANNKKKKRNSKEQIYSFIKVKLHLSSWLEHRKVGGAKIFISEIIDFVATSLPSSPSCKPFILSVQGLFNNCEDLY